VTVQQKPEYCQGHSVYGKKRKDSVHQGRAMTGVPARERHSPSLSVTLKVNLESTKNFMADAFLGRCREFAAANQDDKRIQTLFPSEGGIDRVFSTWLSACNNLALYMAVMSKARKDGFNPSPDFLIRKMTEKIGARHSLVTTYYFQTGFPTQPPLRSQNPPRRRRQLSHARSHVI
jgi:hypothetical protein